MGMMFAITEIGYWLAVRDGDPRATDIYRRHYSYRNYADGRREQYGYGSRFKIAGPGEYMMLLGADERALFVWKKFNDPSGQRDINCSVFRNESDQLSSNLIREASALAWERWPGTRLYTYVNPRAVKSSNPGYCFICAGWRRYGVTRRNRLIILECLP